MNDSGSCFDSTHPLAFGASHQDALPYYSWTDYQQLKEFDPCIGFELIDTPHMIYLAGFSNTSSTLADNNYCKGNLLIVAQLMNRIMNRSLDWFAARCAYRINDLHAPSGLQISNDE